MAVVLGAMRNSSAAMLSHTDLLEGQSGTDNWGRPVTFGTSVGRYIKDREIGQALSGYLDAVGFKHKFETPDWPSYFGAVRGVGESKYDMFILGYGPQSMEPDQLLSLFRVWLYERSH